MKTYEMTNSLMQRIHPQRYPIPFAVITLFLIGMVSGLIAQLLGVPQYRLAFSGPVTILLAFAFRNPKQMMLTTHFRWQSLKYYTLPLLLVVGLPLITGGYQFDAVDSVIFWNMLSIGFFEEVLIHGMFMGLILTKWGYSHQNLKKASIIGAIIFGLLHLSAITADPTDPHLIQWKIATVVFATFISIGFAGLVWQSQSIWGAALVHALIDIVGYVGDPQIIHEIYNQWDWQCSVVSILYSSPMLFLGLWLLNKAPSSY